MPKENKQYEKDLEGKLGMLYFLACSNIWYFSSAFCHVEDGTELFKIAPENRTKNSLLNYNEVDFDWEKNPCRKIYSTKDQTALGRPWTSLCWRCLNRGWMTYWICCRKERMQSRTRCCWMPYILWKPATFYEKKPIQEGKVSSGFRQSTLKELLIQQLFN